MTQRDLYRERRPWTAGSVGAAVALAWAALVCSTGCSRNPFAADPPQFRPNLVDMKMQGVNSNPELAMTAPEKAPAQQPADAAAAAKLVEELYGLQLTDARNGALVQQVAEDKPAGGAGVLPGDVIQKIIVGETKYSVGDQERAVDYLLSKVAWGEEVKLVVFRDQQQQIANVLLALFGTPDQPDPADLDPFRNKSSQLYDEKNSRPSLVEMYGFNLDHLETSAGRVHEKFGRQYGLYRLHCAHCHGITGDGAGPTASFLNPYPRDYRQGKFKFKSTAGAEKPTREDLMRVLTEGIPGTAMPSFRVLPEDERAALVEYVQYLSVRGETEIKLIEFAAGGLPLPSPAALVANLPDEDGNAPDVTEENVVANVLLTWHNAQQQIVSPAKPPEDFVKWVTYVPSNLRTAKSPAPELSSDENARREASLKRGRELFYSDVASCYKCHGDSQLGDGQDTDYDAWFTWRKNLNELSDAAERNKLIDEYLALGALPPRTAKPRDLRVGVYRGGRRPLDIYRKITGGINGTPMPGLKPTEPTADAPVDPAKAATPEDVWHLVHYVLSLPYEPLSQPPKELEQMLQEGWQRSRQPTDKQHHTGKEHDPRS
jgi:mono/diheme cytochrome c family protein